MLRPFLLLVAPLAVAIPLSALSGCKEKETVSVWKLTVLEAADTCNDPPVAYEGPETFDYEMAFEEEVVAISIDGDRFAAGQIAGCNVGYTSVVWAEERDGDEIRWQITGEAIFRAGGTACNMEEGVDWQGTEVFTIISSESPDIEVGCTYSLLMEGKYEGQLER